MNWSSEQPLMDNVESDSLTFSCGNMNISLDRNTFKATGFSEYKKDNSPGSSLEILDIGHVEVKTEQAEMKSKLKENIMLEDVYLLRKSEERCQISEDKLDNKKLESNQKIDHLKLAQSHPSSSYKDYLNCNQTPSHIEKYQHPDHSNIIQNYQKEIQDLKFKLQQSQNREQGLRILFDKHQRQQVEEMSVETERKSPCHLENESYSKVISCEDEKHEICEEDFEKKQHNIQKLEQIIHQLTAKIKDLQNENVILKHQISAIHEDFMKERHDKKVLEQSIDIQKLPLKRSPSYLLDCNLPSNVEPDGV